MNGFSAIVANSNSRFIFVNNSAAREGGGIHYVSSDLREYFEGRSCFIKFGGTEQNVSKRNLFFNFTNNKALLGGPSIYSASLFSCHYAFSGEPVKNLTKVFDNIDYFHFDEISGVYPIATAARTIAFMNRSSLSTISGKKLKLPLVMYDEYGHTLKSEFALRVEGNENVHLDNYFTATNSTHVFGMPNETATLVLSTPQDLYGVDYYVDVSILPCPPGFFYMEHTCICSADSEQHSYLAITKCNYADFRAYIIHGYWAGYYPDDRTGPDNLYTSWYPLSESIQYSNLYQMPSVSENLTQFFCGSARKGIICGECQSGYSAYYHSRYANYCGENKLCEYGLLFYFLSEIIPVAVFLFVVITFGISFSSGNLNGFVLFSQVVEVFSEDVAVFGVYKDSSLLINAKRGHHLIYGLFNFDFISTVPFCLWKDATIMDTLVFKYITTVFALMSIIVMVIVMKYPSRRCIECFRHKWRNRDQKTSAVTHGLSTFLIISYGQCTKTGFSILTVTYLKGRPGINSVPVTYFGGLPYLGKDHLPYAIPAVIFSFLLVILPPLLLFMYPLILHLLAICGLSEHPTVNKSLQYIGMNRLKPLFDSFQSCYKDKMRFFSGLYFFYRVAAYAAYMNNDKIPLVFLAILILGIHSVFHPYKSWKQNVLDTLIFLNLSTISGITIMIKLSLLQESIDDTIALIVIQLILIYLPVFVLTLSLFLYVLRVKLLRSKQKCDVQASSSGCRVETQSSMPGVTHTSIELNEPLITS